MKVHQIINNYGLYAGGAEKLVRILHLRLLEKGMCSSLIGLTEESDDLKHAYSLGLSSPYSPLALWKLYRYIQKNVSDKDIIHSHLFPTNMYCSILKAVGVIRCTLITTEHSTFNGRRGKWWGKLLDKFIYSYYDQIIAISKAVKVELGRWLPNTAYKIRVIYNGVELLFSNPIKKSERQKIIILSIGSLRKAKNYGNALKAIADIPKRNFEWHIAGKGVEAEALKLQAEECGIVDRVKFLGHIVDIKPSLQDADIFLMPSLWEGFGLAAVEAMNASLPVVASDVPGLSEVVGFQNQCAILVEPTNIESIKNAICILLENYEMRVKLGINGFLHAKKFDFDKMVRGYINIYSEIEK